MSERELTPGQSEEVRRLLADARHTEPMPEEVVTRLDAVLDDLSKDRAAPAADVDEPAEDASGSDAPPPVDELGMRRRRRIAAGLLTAAAVTVAGFTLPNVFESGSLNGATSGADGGADGGSGSAEEAEAGRLAPAEDQDANEFGVQESEADAAGEPDAQAPQGAAPPALNAVVRVRSRTFAADVETIVSGRAPAARRSAPLRLPADWCAVRDAWGVGVAAYPVRYATPGATQRSVLVVRAPSGGSRTADLFVCGQDDPTRTASITAD